MSTRTFELTEHFEQFIEAQVASGEFKDASDVMCAGLRLLEERVEENRVKFEQLQELAEEGFRELDQGLGIPIRNRDELRALLRALREKAQARCNVE